MTAEKKFCVYAHHRLSDGKLFYIGKGDKKRANAVQRRSEYWHRVYKKHGRSVTILIGGLSETCAFSMERALIAFFGKENLVNMTDGGEGKTGLVPSAQQREKCSISNKGKKPADHAVRLAIERNSKKVGTECGLRFSSAAEAGRVMFPDKARVAKVMISACCNGKRTRSVYGYKFGFIVDGEFQSPNFSQRSKKKSVKTHCGKIFASSVEASSWLRGIGFQKAQNGNIIQCCKGKVASAYGYQWSYA